ncbi:MAG: hypothetical protein COA58_10410 [Bacteroidetes bacterium]|nr:MAG: hypothetical protein COA58_10410 [Bacteroidota bacterium]
MTKDKTFRDCISSNDNELVIYVADNLPQFPLRDTSIPSKCDRTLAAASLNDLVVLHGKLDTDYYDWLRSFGLGPDFIVEYGADTNEKTLSELIINDPEPIKNIIRKTGRTPVYVPWFSSQKESEASDVLGADFFGSPESETFRYNDKAAFKIICQQLDIPIIEGVSFKMKPQESENYTMMKSIIDGYLEKYKNVIIRGTFGESGMSLYKTNGNDVAEIYKEISDCNEKVVLIEPFLSVSSSPNDQWIIGRNGEISHLGMRAQICKEGMIHVGTISELDISDAESALIKESSWKIVKKMRDTGYIGVAGIDYIVSDEGVFPVENNARFNGSSYSVMIVERIEKLFYKIPVWKFIKVKTDPCSFVDLKKRLKSSIFDGVKRQSIFPYNCDLLQKTGNFNVLILADNLIQISELEQELRTLEASKFVVI